MTRASQSHADVLLTECWGRDGLQSLERVFTTAEKADFLLGFADAGFRRIEVTSFVPPKYLPQFYDAEELLARVRPHTDAELIAFVPNARGMERAAEVAAQGHGPDSALMVVSASEEHNQRNLKRPMAETMDSQRRAAEIAHDAGIGLIGSISVSFGCPYSGDVPVNRVLELVEHYRDIGVQAVQFGDTTGSANPASARAFYERVLRKMDDIEPIAHFHDTRGAAISNSLAAIDAGVRIVDTGLGGTGGRPPDQRVQDSGPTGNTSTEDLAALLEEMGYDTGIDVDRVLALGREFEEMLGRDMYSHITHAGRVPHGQPQLEAMAVNA